MSKKTIETIEEAIKRIRSHPEYSLETFRSVNLALRQESLRQSALVEIASNTRLYIGRNSAEKEVVDSLQKMLGLLSERGISVASINALAPLIKPGKYSGFRTTDPEFGGLNPPHHSKIPQELDNLLGYLEYARDVHPITRSITAHVEITRIQPFEDGNKRTARLVQNYLLHRAGYPPAIIDNAEMEFYWTLLRPVIDERLFRQNAYNPDTHANTTFHGFIESKVLESAVMLEDVLGRSRQYEVMLTGRDIGEKIKGIADAIRHLGKRDTNMDITVQMSRRDNKRQVLHVSGSVGEKHLRTALDRAADMSKVSYELRTTNPIAGRKVQELSFLGP